MTSKRNDQTDKLQRTLELSCKDARYGEKPMDLVLKDQSLNTVEKEAIMKTAHRHNISEDDPVWLLLRCFQDGHNFNRKTIELVREARSTALETYTDVIHEAFSSNDKSEEIQIELSELTNNNKQIINHLVKVAQEKQEQKAVVYKTSGINMIAVSIMFIVAATVGVISSFIVPLTSGTVMTSGGLKQIDITTTVEDNQGHTYALIIK